MFPNLTNLDLTSNTRYTHIGLNYLSQLKNLSFLRIFRMSNFMLDELSLVHISKISSLETLNLDYWNKFKFTPENMLPLIDLPSLKNLKIFTYTEKKVNREIVSTLKRMPSLKLFVCNNCNDCEYFDKELNNNKTGKDMIDVGNIYYKPDIFMIPCPFIHG